MVSRVFLFALCFVISKAGQPGPRYPPTKGEVWPKPQYEKKEPTLFKLKTPIQFKVLDKSCAILTDALNRVQKQLNKQQDVTRKIQKKLKRVQRPQKGPTTQYNAADLHIMEIDMRQPCEAYPFFEMDESYNLTISAVSNLKSGSVWGIMHGLESFLQLFYQSDDYRVLLINATVIQDFPRYAHRGLLLDTSRHYISLDTIKRTIDAMSMNKMNVFHWHIVDDESFPYQSEKFPELSEKGAYHPTMVYMKSDIKDIVNYARDRGIRVIPEIDVPGHTRSWGIAYPQLLTECFTDNAVVGLGPMNPTNNFTYKLLGELIQEVKEWFPDKYYHLGGDEVDLNCWAENPSLQDYMLHHQMSSVKEFHALFMKSVVPLLGDRQPIVWQEVFDNNVPLSNNTLVQVWDDGWIFKMNDVLLSGHGVLFSTEWYLSMLSPGGDWEKFYKADPREKVFDKALAGNVVGGEACMWGEFVDDRNILSRVWPRASAVAERLWSFASLDEPHHADAMVSNDQAGSLDKLPVFHAGSVDSRQASDLEPVRYPVSNATAVILSLLPYASSSDLVRYVGTLDSAAQASIDMIPVQRRLEEHACRMIRRGVPAEPPNGPGFCVT